MPGRAMPLVTGEIYHIFNRGIDKRPTFLTKRHYARAIETIRFYRYSSPPFRLSKYLVLNEVFQTRVLRGLESSVLVDILTLCLMPNHFHFILRQRQDNGISRFLSNVQNSYTRYFNTRAQRVGPLFLDQFKAVRIEDDEQLLHVHRYIHINPYTSFVTKTLNDLEGYVWSSLPDYLSETPSIYEKNTILDYFKTRQSYKKFLFDQVDYQRTLDAIKHILIENPYVS